MPEPKKSEGAGCGAIGCAVLISAFIMVPIFSWWCTNLWGWGKLALEWVRSR